MQAFSLVSGNYNTALCSLVLSQLTDFYESCGDEHLRTVAELILQIVSTDVKDREMKGSEFGLECIVESFLESEGFVEMRRLHHLLLSSYLSTVRYKRYEFINDIGHLKVRTPLYPVELL